MSAATAAPASLANESLVMLYPTQGNPYLQQVKLRLEKRKTLQVVEAASPNHISETIQNIGSGLLFICVRNFQDLKLVSKCLTELKGVIRDRSLRVLGVTDLDDPRVHSLLKGRGCMEVYPSRLIWQSLENNINYAIGILTMQRIFSTSPQDPTRSSTPFNDLTAAGLAEDLSDATPFDSELESKLKVWICSSDPADTRMAEAKVIEYGSDSLLLEVSSKLCSEGQDAFLIMDDRSQNSESKFRILVKLSAVIPTETDRQLVSIGLHGGLGKFLEPIQKIQAKLQNKIFDFLKATRGW